jgi:uncharacterized membrane protein YfcA
MTLENIKSVESSDHLESPEGEDDIVKGTPDTVSFAREPAAGWLIGLIIVSLAIIWSLFAFGNRMGETGTEVQALAGAVIFASALVSSIAGFAFSAIAGAFLIHITQDHVSLVMLLVTCSIVIQLYGVFAIRRSIRIEPLIPYLVGGSLAAPLGVALLLAWPSGLYALLFGGLVVVYSVYALVSKNEKPTGTVSRFRDMVWGGFGGVVSGLTGAPGVPVNIRCARLKMSKDEQRAIVQPFILCVQIQTLIWLKLADRGVSGSLADTVVYLPLALLAAMGGMTIFRRMGNDRFKLVVNILLLASGVSMVMKGVGL